MPSRSRRLGIRGRLAALLPALLLVLGGWCHRWSAEDAFIDFRMVRNILLGHGPVLNVGERVEAITNPLWMWLVAGAAGLADLLGASEPPIEWSAAVLGLCLSGLGLWWLVRASEERWAESRPGSVVLPLGALIYAALPPAWDFVTSGLETSLCVAWLGVSALLLGRCTEAGRPATTPVAAGIIVGLGPLIRPDLALVAGPLFLALLLGAWMRRRGDPPGARWKELALLSLATAAIPVAYQVFRMGYYAALVPNTALAKEAGLASWLHGLYYLGDFVGTYHLWLPVTLLAALGLGPLRVRIGEVARGRAPVTLALLVGGTAHGIFIVRAGGDFMHARLLLPSALTALAAFAAVPVERQGPSRVGAVLILGWAGLCAGLLRPSYHADVVGPEWSACTSGAGLTDERCFFMRTSGADHPVTHRDYRRHIWTQDGYSLSTIASSWTGLLPTRQPAYEVVVFGGELESLPLAGWVQARVAALRCNVGLTGFAAGSEVHIIDCRGLGEPIAARLALDASIRPEEVARFESAPIPPLLGVLLRHMPGGWGLLERIAAGWRMRSRPGHEKELPAVWAVARYGALSAGESPATAMARQSLTCGSLAHLHDAITQPLTPARFLENLGRSVRLSRLRVPADPAEAVTAFCSPVEPAGSP